MLSIDYKLFSKILDNRLKLVLDDIIELYQTGFMSGRYILTNVLKLIEIMTVVDANKTKAIVMAIDFEKCFDMISFSAIEGALRYFGIGEKFVNNVMLLFTDFQLCTQNNGYISDWITPTRGLHQGCCISPHLFNCTGQVFADLLNSNSNIDAFVARGIRSLLAQFADDTSMFYKGNERSVKAVIHTLNYAERNLGLKVNIDKTVMYRIGSLTHTDAKFYTRATFAWAEPPIFTLGIHVTTNEEEMAKLNLIPIIRQTEETLQIWSKRKLTLTGRVLIANTLIESKLVYRFGVIANIDDMIMQQLQDIIWEYIWQGKRAKISFNILRTPKDQGGLRLCDVRAKHKTILCQWVFTLKDDGLLHRAMRAELMQGIGYEELWNCNLNEKDILLLLPKQTFWRAVLIAWSHYNHEDPVTYQQVTTKFVWYNTFIRKRGTPYIQKKLYELGLRFVSDLLDQYGNMMSVQGLCEKYGDEHWIDLYGLTSSLPQSWMIILNNIRAEDTESFIGNYDKLKLVQKPTKYIYRKLTSEPDVVRASYWNWMKVDDFDTTYAVYMRNFISLSILTMNTKLRDFQYRLLHKRLPTNRELYRWKIKTTSLCECGSEDSIQHTLYECADINKLWLDFAIFITTTYESEVFVVNLTEVVLNRINYCESHITNTYCLILKQLIYRNKCLTRPTRFEDFLEEIKLVHQNELTLAKMSKKVNLHRKKWSTNQVVTQEQESDNFRQFIDNYLQHM